MGLLLPCSYAKRANEWHLNSILLWLFVQDAEPKRSLEGGGYILLDGRVGQRTDVHVLLNPDKAVSHKTWILGKMSVCPFSRFILCSERGRGTEERQGGRGRNLFCTEKIWVEELLG